MRAKSERRLEAERLRREAGLSYNEIAARTGISKSTLSSWLRDIPYRFIKTQFDPRSRATELTGDYHGVCTVTYNDTYLQQRLLGLAHAYVRSRFASGGPRSQKQTTVGAP